MIIVSSVLDPRRHCKASEAGRGNLLKNHPEEKQ
jgi:hypothetical protein